MGSGSRPGSRSAVRQPQFFALAATGYRMRTVGRTVAALSRSRRRPLLGLLLFAEKIVDFGL